MCANVSIIMYHFVREIAKSKYPGIKGLELSQFREQIQFLSRNYPIITMEDFIHWKNGELNLPNDVVMLTFDDGYLEHYENVFPILEENKVQGSFYIPGVTIEKNVVLDVNKIQFVLACKEAGVIVSDIFVKLNQLRAEGFVLEDNEALYRQYATKHRYDCREVRFIKQLLQYGLPKKIREQVLEELFQRYVLKDKISETEFSKSLYLNKEQLQEMRSNGMYIGLHGYSHQWLGEMQRDEVEEEIKESCRVLATLIDRDCWTMNYPYGSYNSDVIEIIKEKGCKSALTVKTGMVERTDDIFQLPRLDTNDYPPKSNEYLNYRH